MADWQVFSFHSFSWESSPCGTLHVDCNSVWGELITKVTIVLTSWWEYASKQDNISSAIYIYIIQMAPVYASGGMASCVADWHGICIWTSLWMSEANILSSSRTSHIDMKSWSRALLVTKNWSSIGSLNHVFPVTMEIITVCHVLKASLCSLIGEVSGRCDVTWWLTTSLPWQIVYILWAWA